MTNEPLDIQAWSAETQEVCRLCLGKLKSILEQVDVNEIEVRDAKGLYNLSNSVAAVSKAIHALEMSTRDRNSILREIREQFTAECKKIMASEPELMDQVLTVLERAERLAQLENQ